MATLQATVLVAGPAQRVQTFLSSVESKALEQGRHLRWAVLLSDARILALQIELFSGASARDCAAASAQHASGPQAFELADLANSDLVVFAVERLHEGVVRLDVLKNDEHHYRDDDLYRVEDNRPDAARRLSLALALWEGVVYAQHGVQVQADVALN